jgi:hypothetical protein
MEKRGFAWKWVHGLGGVIAAVVPEERRLLRCRRRLPVETAVTLTNQTISHYCPNGLRSMQAIGASGRAGRQIVSSQVRLATLGQIHSSSSAVCMEN